MSGLKHFNDSEPSRERGPLQPSFYLRPSASSADNSPDLSAGVADFRRWTGEDKSFAVEAPRSELDWDFNALGQTRSNHRIFICAHLRHLWTILRICPQMARILADERKGRIACIRGRLSASDSKPNALDQTRSNHCIVICVHLRHLWTVLRSCPQMAQILADDGKG